MARISRVSATATNALLKNARPTFAVRVVVNAIPKFSVVAWTGIHRIGRRMISRSGLSAVNALQARGGSQKAASGSRRTNEEAARIRGRTPQARARGGPPAREAA